MRAEFLPLLQALVRHRVEFVLVGGVAAVIEGAIVNTLDLDIVYASDEPNLHRLLAAVLELGALYRDPAGRRIAPTIERLRDNRINLLRSPAGDLDAMQQIAPG